MPLQEFTPLEKYFIGLGRDYWPFSSRIVNLIKKSQYDSIPEDIRNIILGKGFNNNGDSNNV
jgi:hypothetical protein